VLRSRISPRRAAVKRRRAASWPLGARPPSTLLPAILGLAWRKTIPTPLGELAATVALALLSNAFVCGALSNPHDRYGARMVWLAMLVAILALLRMTERRRRQ
jgi:hypothetical protein